MVRTRPIGRHRLPDPVDEISEEELQKDLSYVKSDDDGLARSDDWPPPGRRGRLKNIDVDLVDLGDGISGDDKKTESLAGEEKTVDRDDEFEQLKAISSRLQKLDEVSNPKLGRRNDTGHEGFHQMPEDFKLKKGDAETPSMDDESLPEYSKLSAFSGTKKTTENGFQTISLEGNNAKAMRPKVHKGRTTKSWKKSTLMSTEPVVLNGLHGRKTTRAPSANINQSDYGFDDDSISSLIGQSGTSHANKTSFSIVDEGTDKVDIPLTGSSWHTAMHGRREVVIAGSVISIVGILLLIMAIIYVLMQRRRKKSKNANNNQQYRQLGAEDESVALMKPTREGFTLMSSSEASDDEENDEEDTLYIRGRRKPVK